MVDAEIGRILKALDDSRQRDNTLVIFTGDHGEGLGHHRMVRKSTGYDEAAKVPLLISWPGELPKNKVDNYLVSGLDMMPTICDFAGIKAPSGMKGKSLRTILEGQTVNKSDFIALEMSSNLGQMIRTDSVVSLPLKQLRNSDNLSVKEIVRRIAELV